MSLGQTSNPKCGPAFPWIAFFFSSHVSLSCSAQKGWVPHPSGEFRSVCWCLGPQDERRELGGRAGPGNGSGIHCQPGQLVNFVGMHLVERRCINIRSLSADCVSRLGGGEVGGPQMPFVKKTRMASRRPWTVAAGPRAVLRVRAQNLGRAECLPAKLARALLCEDSVH